MILGTFHTLKMIMAIIKLYRTWPLVILDRCNLLNGTIKLVLRNGVQYLVRAKIDIGKINAIYIGKEYNEHLDNITDNSIAIDIGAHIGIFSILAKGLAKNVTVYSYEPFKENFQLLKENIRLNNANGNIHAFNLGIGGKGGLRKLFLDKTNPGANSMFNKTSDFVYINTLTLKDVFDENGLPRCDFLKMDCEGAEYEILYNTPKEHLDKIISISMEFHDNESVDKLTGFLEDNGFKTKVKEKDHLLYAKKK